MKHTSLGILFLIFISAAAAQDKVKQLDQYFTALDKYDQFNGSILVAEKGKTIYQRSFGYADFENRLQNTLATPFPIASISKTFNATAVLQLAEKGKLNVNDPVKKHLIWFPYADMSIKHLLSHTSGHPTYNSFFENIRKQQTDRVFTNADFKAAVLANPKPLAFPNGERNRYDNVNFIVTALLIEHLSGLAYPEYISKNILEPANMKHTYFSMPVASKGYKAISEIAYPHLFPHQYSDQKVRASTVPYIAEYWSAYHLSGFGDYISTLNDLLAYDQAYYDGKLLGKEIIAEAFTPVVLNSGKPGSFGLGWQLSPDPAFGKVVYHNGNTTGLSCTLIRNIDRRQTIILFDNIHGNNSESTGFAVLKMLNGGKVSFPRQSLAKVFVREFLSNGIASARQKTLTLKADTINYNFSEDELNLIAYDLMGGPNNPNPYRFPEEKKYKEALEVFKFINEQFPDSWNSYDSYGEVLALIGDKPKAIEMYRRSIELNSKNEGGKKALAELLAKK